MRWLSDRCQPSLSRTQRHASASRNTSVYCSIIFFCITNFTHNWQSCLRAHACQPTTAANTFFASYTTYTFTDCTGSSNQFKITGHITAVDVSVLAMQGSSVSFSIDQLAASSLSNSVIRITDAPSGRGYIYFYGGTLTNVTIIFSNILEGNLLHTGTSRRCVFKFLKGSKLGYTLTGNSIEDTFVFSTATTALTLDLFGGKATLLRSPSFQIYPGGAASITFPNDLVHARVTITADPSASLPRVSSTLTIKGAISQNTTLRIHDIEVTSVFVGEVSKTLSTGCTAQLKCKIELHGVVFNPIGSNVALTVSGTCAAFTDIRVTESTARGLNAGCALTSLSLGPSTVVNISHSTFMSLLMEYEALGAPSSAHTLMIVNCTIGGSSSSVPMTFNPFSSCYSGSHILILRNNFQSLIGQTALSIPSDCFLSTTYVSILSNTFSSTVSPEIVAFSAGMFEMWNNVFHCGIGFVLGGSSGTAAGRILIVGNIFNGLLVVKNSDPSSNWPKRVFACNTGISFNGLSSGFTVAICSDYLGVSRCGLDMNTFAQPSPRIASVNGQRSIESCDMRGFNDVIPIRTVSEEQTLSTFVSQSRSVAMTAKSASSTQSKNLTISASANVTSRTSTYTMTRTTSFANLTQTPTLTLPSLELPVTWSEDLSRTLSGGRPTRTLTAHESPSVSRSYSFGGLSITVTFESSPSATVSAGSLSPSRTTSFPSLSQSFSAGSVTARGSLSRTKAKSLTCTRTLTLAPSRSFPRARTISLSVTRSAAEDRFSGSSWYVPSDAAKTAQDLSGSLAVVGSILGGTSGQLTTVMALIRLVRCGDDTNDDTIQEFDSLPIIVHPLRFSVPIPFQSFPTAADDGNQSNPSLPKVEDEDEEFMTMRTATTSANKTVPTTAGNDEGHLELEAGRERLMAQYRGAIIGGCFLVPLLAAVVLYWPLSLVIGLVALPPKIGRTARSTLLVSVFSELQKAMARGRELVAWPSIVITPYVVLVEGIAQSAVVLAADGGANMVWNALFAALGALTILALIFVWGWVFWTLPLRRLSLSDVQYVSFASFVLSARKEWELEEKPLLKPVSGTRSDVCADNTGTVANEGGASDEGDGTEINARVHADNEEKKEEKWLALTASFMSEKWLIWADMASFVLSAGVGIMEGVEPSSAAVCLPRAIAAVVLALLQCVLGLLTLIPADMALNVAQTVLSIVVSCILIVIVSNHAGAGVDSVLDDLNVAIALLGIAGILIGFVQVRSRAKMVRRYLGHASELFKSEAGSDTCITEAGKRENKKSGMDRRARDDGGSRTDLLLLEDGFGRDNSPAIEHTVRVVSSVGGGEGDQELDVLLSEEEQSLLVLNDVDSGLSLFEGLSPPNYPQNNQRNYANGHNIPNIKTTTSCKEEHRACRLLRDSYRDRSGRFRLAPRGKGGAEALLDPPLGLRNDESRHISSVGNSHRQRSYTLTSNVDQVDFIAENELELVLSELERRELSSRPTGRRCDDLPEDLQLILTTLRE